jgi:hypothetical protein
MRRAARGAVLAARWSAIVLLCAYVGGAAWVWCGAWCGAAVAAIALGYGFIRTAGGRWLIGRGLILAVLVLLAAVAPTTRGNWSPDQVATVRTVWRGQGELTILNVRNCRYRSPTDVEVAWETRRVDIAAIDQVWLLVEPFDPGSAIGHILISFGYRERDGARAYLAVSVEIRRERGEAFSALAGLYKRYELMYVVGDERDLIRLRADHRHDECFLYPLRATPQQAKALFQDMLARAEQLASEPEFYHTLFNTCTTHVVDHVNHIWPGTVPLAREVVLPGNADRLAHRLGLIDCELPFAACRERHRINARSLAAADATYSLDIRRRDP